MPGLIRWHLLCGLLPVLVACKPQAGETELRAVVAQQVAVAHASYQQSLASARVLDARIALLIERPGTDTLEAARSAWRAARVPYGQTEALRFGHGVVDALEPRVNAWPIDEGLLDYVGPGYQAAADNPAARANFVASDYLEFAGIRADLSQVSLGTLRYLNELLGIESNVTRGYHAIEFLLWGQDFSDTGPGARPWTDYAPDARCTDGPNKAAAKHCAKRGQLLRAASQLLVLDLIDLDAEWNPDQGSYARRLIAGDPKEALRRMLFGMAAMARDELAGQRIEAGLLSGGQEEEQDCFSDNTPHSHAANARGVANLYWGRTPDAAPAATAHEHSLAQLLARVAPKLDQQLRTALSETEAALQAVQQAADGGLPYDQMLRPEHAQGRALLQRSVRALQAEGALLMQAGEALRLGALNPAARPPELGEAAAAPRQADPDEALPGGATTVQPRTTAVVPTRDALSQPAANLSLEARARFFVGNSFFTAAWVAAPASTTARDGLGPLYNAAACQNCHIKDGRGHPPETPGAAAVSFLVKVGRAPTNADEAALARRIGAVPDPVYGHQIQDRAVAGVPPEAQVGVHWREQPFVFADGTKAMLRQPELQLKAMAYGPLAAGQAVSARVAPPMTGLGLLEAIPIQQLQALEDPNDADGNGISGRLNRVWNASAGKTAIGRFGWKASQPTVRQQAALAANLDMGLSSVEFAQGDCTAEQRACLSAPNGGVAELPPDILDTITFYAEHLAVPARRWIDPPEVRAGEARFTAIGCAACHVPAFRTGAASSAALAGQAIRPYSDLLLHDLGPGLADGVPEFAASGSEWRTPPLWGLHLAQRVNPHAGFLHDGRARNLEEAILWHGGEAESARNSYAALPKAQREELIWFLKSL